ncbi:UvrB/UvrC motif-containing protein [Virgibacillus siamensis]|uniref:UvrB/UvrC motif-containing protein n=1 Tax=Virgibacillus siamensis TaxID=480071 RepID=UPI000985C04C|nr:UvrB/UvrC motif-containing protein [Virgibacillus siamensis]
MECQECHNRSATLHFTQVINGSKTEVHVCEKCAQEKGYMTYPDDGYSLHDLLTGLFNFDASSMESPQKTSYQQTKELQCPQCKMTFSEFKRVGKFGCAECYHTFSNRLDPILRRVHSGNTQHSGKIPNRKGGALQTKKQIESLKNELQGLIKEEAFEEAAKVRDQIKELENHKRGDNS